MKNICFYCIATQLGGAERSLLELIIKIAENRDKINYTPRVLVPKEDGPLIDELRKLQITIDVLPMPSRFLKISRTKPIHALLNGFTSTPELAKYILKFVTYIKKTNPDLIYTTGIKCHLLAALANSINDKEILWHLRDIMNPGLTLTTLQFLSKSKRVHLLANSIATANSFSKSKMPIVYNGFNPKNLKKNKNHSFREHFQISGDIPIIGMLGVIARWKGQLEFLKMARMLLDSGIKARFVIIGNEIYDTVGERGFLNVLKAETLNLGLQEYVYFSGFIKNPEVALNGLDILVHASKKPEPFGRVIVEAMACEVPVIASRAGGVLEIIEHEKTGLLYEPGNATQMMCEVSRLLNDTSLKDRLSKNARKIFLEKFTSDQYFQAMNQEFEKIFSAKSLATES